MSSLAPELRFEALLLAQADALTALMGVEVRAYPFPWTRRNFEDGLRAGYQIQQLRLDGRLAAYYVAMPGVDEVHLLNLTVAPEFQRQGLARTCLQHLVEWAGQDLLARSVWLEVRASNQRAQALYERFGFVRVGHRKGYYPNGEKPREDAVVMKLDVVALP